MKHWLITVNTNTDNSIHFSKMRSDFMISPCLIPLKVTNSFEYIRLVLIQFSAYFEEGFSINKVSILTEKHFT